MFPRPCSGDLYVNGFVFLSSVPGSRVHHINPLSPDGQMNYDEIALKKAGFPLVKLFAAAFFAGLFIAFGALCSQIAGVDTGLKIASAAVFPIGLIMVVLVGAELFTGNNLMTYAVFNRRLSYSALLKNWLIVYVGNLFGSLFLAQCVVLGQTDKMFDARLTAAMIATAEAKVGLPPADMLMRGIFCNILVCIAVWCAIKAKSVPGKILSVFFPTFAFVYCGFEHSIANMYFIPVGMMAQFASGSGSEIPLAGLLLNLFFVSIGNIIGGALITAGGLWIMDRTVSGK